MADTLEDVSVVEKVYEPGDAEKFSHYVRKTKLGDSSVFGTPITALCGKVWVPTRDPKKFPVCPDCKDIYESMAS